MDLVLINDLNEAVNRGETLDSILNILWERTEKLFDSIGAGIYLLSEDQNELVLQMNRSAKKNILKIEKLAGKKIPSVTIQASDTSIYWKTFKTGKPFYTDNVNGVANLMGEHKLPFNHEKLIPTAVRILNLSSMLNIPLFSGDKPLGIFSTGRKGTFNKQEIDRLIAFSTQVTSILERISIEEKNRQQSDDQGLINEINRAANEGKGLIDILLILSAVSYTHLTLPTSDLV